MKKMTLSIGKKLNIFIGTLLLLIIIVGAVSVIESVYLHNRVKEITEVDHRTSIASYEMQINISGIHFYVLRYMSDHSADHLASIELCTEQFNNFQREYRNLPQTEYIRELGVKVDSVFREFRTLADTIVNEESRKMNNLNAIRQTLTGMNMLLEDKVVDPIRRFEIDRTNKMKSRLNIQKTQINVNEILYHLEDYLRTHAEIPEKEIYRTLSDFNAGYNDLWQNEQNRAWLPELKKNISDIGNRVKDIIGTEKIKENQLVYLQKLHRDLSFLLEEQILLLVNRSLSEAKQNAEQASRQSTLFILIAVIVSLIFGTATSFFLVTGIITPLKKLTASTRQIALGDFSQKIDLQTKDELGDLVQAYNKMIGQLEASGIQQAELMNELKRSNQAMEDFAHIISHDLKAPLRGISSVAEWVIADYGNRLDKEGKDMLRLLTDRTNKMQSLIDGVLSYSRIGRVKQDKEQIDLNKLVDEVIGLLNPPAVFRIRITQKLPEISFYRTGMLQVFQNLIGNAIKYMDKPEGIVTIGCSVENDTVKISVSDNGPGIDERYHENIFQIFQTVQSGETKDSTGVGLTIVKKIIEDAGGKIGVQSSPGKGSTFWFTVPS